MTYAKIENLKNVGFFSAEEEVARQMKVFNGRAGSVEDRFIVSLCLLVDPEDGMIVDAKFQAIGPVELIAAAELASELVVHKYYDQARRIGADLMNNMQASSCTHLVVDALKDALEKCVDIPLPESYVSPVPHDIEVIEGGYPGFEALSLPSKLAVIEDVVKEEIRPYIELDGGGIDVINLLNGHEIIVMYKGSCTSCFSSTGATLSYIQQMLQAKIHPTLTVVPEFEV